MGKFTDKGILDLTSLMFETAADPSGEGWADVYRRLCELTSSGPGSIHVFNKPGKRYAALADTNEPGFLDQINRTYLDKLPYKERITSLKAGEEFQRRREISDKRFKNTEVYRDYFQRLGLFHVLHYCILEDRSTAAGITFTRPETMGDFEPATRSLMRTVVPALQRSMQLHVKVVEAKRHASLVAESWDRIPQGVVLVSEKGRIVYMNASAEQTLRAKIGLSVIRSGKLACAVSADTAALKDAIASSFNTGGHAGSGAALKIRDAAGSHSLSLLVVPVGNAGVSVFGIERCAAVFISGTSDHLRTIGDSLTQVYSLTAAEANVAQLLADGQSLNEIGETLSISQNTVKTHLKRIFAKTDTQRQSSLMKILHHIPRTIQRNSV